MPVISTVAGALILGVEVVLSCISILSECALILLIPFDVAVLFAQFPLVFLLPIAVFPLRQRLAPFLYQLKLLHLGFKLLHFQIRGKSSFGLRVGGVDGCFCSSVVTNGFNRSATCTAVGRFQARFPSRIQSSFLIPAGNRREFFLLCLSQSSAPPPSDSALWHRVMLA